MRDIAYLYAFDGMADWEYGYLVAELNSGRFFARKGERLEVVAVGRSRESLRTMGGLCLVPDISVEDIDDGRCALLILPGGDSWFGPGHEAILEKARSLLDDGVPVAAICAATFGVAGVGLLDERKHTSNDLGFLKATCPKYRGEALYRTEGAVLDRGLITANGVAPLEFTSCVLGALGLLSAEALEAWNGLFKSHEPEYYFRLMKAMEGRE
jgi:putative intracellular protease/amidase